MFHFVVTFIHVVSTIFKTIINGCFVLNFNIFDFVVFVLKGNGKWGSIMQKHVFHLFYWPQNSIHTKENWFFMLFYFISHSTQLSIKRHKVSALYCWLFYYFGITLYMLSYAFHTHVGVWLSFSLLALTLPMTHYPLVQDNFLILSQLIEFCCCWWWRCW